MYSGTPVGAQSSTGQRVGISTLSEQKPRRVAPGRVAFDITPGGEWVGFSPAGERSIFASGGISVFAADHVGGIYELGTTLNGGADPTRESLDLRPTSEGRRAGMRYPSPRPDDDGDGAIDEDRLDGIDNDGDGMIDEDYAAVGDEMVVTVAVSGRMAGPSVKIHQRVSGWSLRHLGGMLALQITVENLTSEPFEHVRIAGIFDKATGTAITTHGFDAARAASASFEEPLISKAIVISNHRPSMAALFFAPIEDTDGSAAWITGETRASRPLSQLIAASEREDVLTHPDVEYSFGNDDSQSFGQNEARIVFGVSPDLGSLEPGQSATVFIALVAISDVDRVHRDIQYAYRTVVGDGTHRMIPPPMEVTRRVVSGTYELRGDRAQYGSTVVVTLNHPRSEGIVPSAIEHLYDGHQTIDVRTAFKSETASGNVTIEVESSTAFDGDGRVMMRGRLSNGEFFDVVLSPVQERNHERRGDGERYLGQPGKLDEALLTGSPNPFHDATTIFYEIPSRLVDEKTGAEYELVTAIEASVKVYDVTGRLVSTLVDDKISPGRFSTQWNAQNAFGRNVASGVYYVKLQVGKKYVTKRLIQLK